MQLIQQLIDTNYPEPINVKNDVGHQIDVKHIVDTLGNLLTIPLFHKVFGVRKGQCVPLLRTDPGIIAKFPVIVAVSHRSRGYGWMFCYCHERHKYIRTFYRSASGQVQFGKDHHHILKAINPSSDAWLEEIIRLSRLCKIKEFPQYPSLGQIRAFMKCMSVNGTPLSIATESFLDKLLGVNTATGYIRFLSLLVRGKVDTTCPDVIKLTVADLEIEFTLQHGKAINYIAPSRPRGYHKDLVHRLTQKRTDISFDEPFEFAMLEHLHFIISFIGAINTKSVGFPEYDKHDNTYTENKMSGIVMYVVDELRDRYLVISYKSLLIGV